MLAACRLHSDKGQIQNSVLTTGVNKAPFSKTFTNGGCYGSLGNFLKILLTSTKPKIKWYLLSVWMLYNCTTGVPTSMRALDSKNCNLKFTDFREIYLIMTP